MSEVHKALVETGGSSLSPGLQRALEQLPAGLRDHVQRVREIARELAGPLGMDLALVDLAAAAHDIARAAKGDALLAEAQRLGLPVSLVEAQLPVLLHGPVGAEWLRARFGVTEPQVLEAVRWHSTAAPGLSPLARLVFLADKLDPDKATRYPFLEEVRSLAPRDLDRAMLRFLTRELRRLLGEEALVHPASVEARNELLAQLKKRS